MTWHSAHSSKANHHRRCQHTTQFVPERPFVGVKSHKLFVTYVHGVLSWLKYFIAATDWVAKTTTESTADTGFLPISCYGSAYKLEVNNPGYTHF